MKFLRKLKSEKGQSLVELLITIGLSAILIPALLAGFSIIRSGRVQQDMRLQATTYVKEAEEAMQVVQANGWSNLTAGTYHPVVSGTTWILISGSEAIANTFTRQVVISDVFRDSSGNIASSGGTLDPSTKQIAISVFWNGPISSNVSSVMYLTRYRNSDYTETLATDFNKGTQNNTQVTNVSGGEITLSNNNKAKWCSPSLSSSTIDLPDGPPVAVSAYANATSTAIPNNVFVATSPYATNSVKLAFVNVTANTATPVASLHGIFTLDPARYSAPGLVPSGINLTNNFITNDIKYYTSINGNLYALLATNIPDKEVIAIQITSAGKDSFQDPKNKIYKYWTFFNTKQYPASTGNDQVPFGYGAVSIVILGSTGYIDSGGYLYAFDLSNVDSKSTSNSLDQIGCRILIDGYDCKPGTTASDLKYAAGETGTSWSDVGSPVHNTCADGGNIELDADHQLSAVQVQTGNKYIYIAVGAGTNPELDIVDVTTPPSSSNTLKSSSCGRGSNTGWKVTGTLDFNSASNTEEAANSVYAKQDATGSRAYMSSNGGIIHNGISDSDQFYIIDTTNKSSPQFLSTWQSTVNGQHYANTAESGYYNGNSTNIELYPRRALTVLNGLRAVLVGQDGIPNDGIEPQEYQVLDLTNEATLNYCGGINFLPGFNDLTSVSEADGDNFVYMVANTMEKQLKIIQGGPDNAVYTSSGIFESQTFNAGSTVMFNRFFTTTNIPVNTSITYQISVEPAISGSCSGVTYSYVGPDGTANTTFSSNGTLPRSSSGIGYQNPGQCFKYKVFMGTTDQTITPTLYDFNVNYSQ